MEVKVYATKVKNIYVSQHTGKTYTCSDYVRGRINGIMYAICALGSGDGCHYKVHFNRTDDGRKIKNVIMLVKCSEKDYIRFSEIVEGLYPGLCEFDVRVDM